MANRKRILPPKGVDLTTELGRWIQQMCEYVNNEKHGEQNTSDFAMFEDDGTLVFKGESTAWDDVYPSSVTVGLGGTAPTFSAYSGNMKAYEFTGGVSNKEIHVGYQIYHSYEEGSLISPHLHIYLSAGAATAGQTVIFDCEYHWDNIGDTGAVSTATLTGTYTIGASNTVYKNDVFSFTGAGSGTGLNTPIVGTGKKISSTLMTKVTRRQDLDSYGGSVWLLSADVHIEKDTIGSRSIFVK